MSWFSTSAVESNGQIASAPASSITKSDVAAGLEKVPLARASPPFDEKCVKLPVASGSVQKTLFTSAVGSQFSQHVRNLTKKPITVRLVQQTSLSGTGTAFPVLALSPVGVQDYSGFAGLYDLFRVKSMKIWILPGTSSATPGLGALWAAGFDPANAGAYTNISDVLTSQKCIGPVSLSVTSGAATLAVTASGGYRLNITPKDLPATSIVTNVSSANQLSAGGGWQGTSTSSAVPVGWLKAGLQGGSGVGTSLTIFVTYETEFASRT